MRRAAMQATLISAVAFVLYAALAARDVMFGDGPELTSAAILNTVAHPPGYPLWIMLGHLASLLPAGPLPYRVNLTACVYHALTVGLVYASAYVLTKRRLPALIAAIVLGLGSPLFVVWSLQAEVFSLTDMFAAAIVLLSVLIIDRPRQWRLVIPLAVIFGLGLSHQMTLLLLGPAALWALWCARNAIPRTAQTVGVAFLAAALLLVGFALPYVHTLIVSQHVPWQLGRARSLSELLWVIERKDYGGAFALVGVAAAQGGTFLSRTWTMLSNQGWPIAVALCGTAAVLLRRRMPQAVYALLIVALPMLLFCAIANIGVRDASMRAVFARFGLLSLTSLAPFAACAIAELRARSVQFAALASALTISAARLPDLSLAGVHDPRTLYRDIFASLPPHAILLTAGDAVDQPPVYFQNVEHWRPDVTIVVYGMLNAIDYVRRTRAQINIPDRIVLMQDPTLRRDVIAFENPRRPLYCVGETGIHAPGPRYTPQVVGIVSRVVPKGTRVITPANLRAMIAAQSVFGYGNVTSSYWRSNGFSLPIREYYAGGFFTTGYYAELLHERDAALAWYKRAQQYSDNPLIAKRIAMLH